MRHYKYVYGLHSMCPVCGIHYLTKLTNEQAQDFWSYKKPNHYLNEHVSCSKCHGDLKFISGSPLHIEGEDFCHERLN